MGPFTLHSSIKMPVQTPNYEDFSCQFSFGKTPSPPEEDEALATPCFAQCPSKQRHLRAESLCSGCEA